ncbi:helix-turn-helix domain-containing protein [Amycolatopsis sp. CA-230715]|uniref:helix-turn-helix domain-containing protein n=1 Tax=Amycolatopsis sp. CA-230715 TaxID=2745196 RepID=UPI001C00CBBC|nr:helix-turn-helix transcriptional regulator [Amycolatopsis sp. CA-230715]QWF81938.1 hypothetical protein HUW46_05373 [Amycolatopsis sp. CA-230715]
MNSLDLEIGLFSSQNELSERILNDRAFIERTRLRKDRELIAYRDEGEWLNRLREQNKMLIRHLCDLTNLSRSAIQCIEHGRQRPSLYTLRKLAYALGVEPDQLILLVAEDYVARDAHLYETGLYQPDRFPVRKDGKELSRITWQYAVGNSHQVRLGSHIHAIRNRASITQKEWAKRSRMGATILSKIENSRYNLSTVPLLIGVAIGLRVPLDELTSFVVLHQVRNRNRAL